MRHCGFCVILHSDFLNIAINLLGMFHIKILQVDFSCSCVPSHAYKKSLFHKGSLPRNININKYTAKTPTVPKLAVLFGTISATISRPVFLIITAKQVLRTCIGFTWELALAFHTGMFFSNFSRQSISFLALI